MVIIHEPGFRILLEDVLLPYVDSVRSVTGPGRSGAIASVYTSYILRIPFIPYGAPCPDHLRPLLIVDTARKSGRTLRKAARKYEGDRGGEGSVITVYVCEEPPRVKFWYEESAHRTRQVTRGENEQ